MQQEFERQMAMAGNASQMNQFQMQPPLSQNRNQNYDTASEMMEMSQWDASQEPNGRD